MIVWLARPPTHGALGTYIRTYLGTRRYGLAAPGLPFYMCPLQEMEREVASLRGQLEAIEKLKYANVHSCWQCSVTYIRTLECP